MKKSASLVVAATAGLVAICVSLYFMALARSISEIVASLLVHSIAAIVCALGGAAAADPQVSSTKGSRPAFFVLFVGPSLLLPIGGVLTVLGIVLILRSKPVPQTTDEDLYVVGEPRKLSRATSPILEPFVGLLRSSGMETTRAMATGIENAAVSEPERAAHLIRRLQLDSDTETRFRAQGALARVTRRLEEHLHVEGNQAEACLELSRLSEATGANPTNLVASAADHLQAENPTDTSGLSLRARALLRKGDTPGAAKAIEKLRARGASRQMLAALEAELLFQRGAWKALAKYCADIETSNPDLLANVRFWTSSPA